MHVRIKPWSDLDQLEADSDGSSWNVPEMWCAALHTGPQQVNSRLTGGKNEQTHE